MRQTHCFGPLQGSGCSTSQQECAEEQTTHLVAREQKERESRPGPNNPSASTPPVTCGSPPSPTSESFHHLPGAPNFQHRGFWGFSRANVASRIAHTMFKEKNRVGKLILPDVKTHYSRLQDTLVLAKG